MPPKINIKKQINKSLENTRSKLKKTVIKINKPAASPLARLQPAASPLARLQPVMPNNLKVVKEIIKGRNDYPEKVLKLLTRYGSEPVVGFSLKRSPVSKLLTSALSVASKGEFNERLKNSEYDQLFHLYLEITLQSGKKLLVEKNEVINMIPSTKRPNEEIRIISSVPKNLTIDIIMNNAKKSMGANFFTYSANNNNCQDFIVNIMRSNKIGNAQDIAFVKQDTKFLFKNLPNLRKTSNTLTTVGARLDVIKNLL
jgi:hypothetical protein